VPRHLAPALALAALATIPIGPCPAAAGWSPEGVPLCTGCAVSGMLACPDGAGGAFVAIGLVGGSGDIALQRITAAGEIPPGWPANGVPVVTDPAIQSLSSIAPDGFGGAIVAWEDSRNGAGYDVYAQRILADGSIAPSWQVNGMPVTRAPGQQVNPVVLGDGTGGAFFSWTDHTSSDIYLQRLTASGEVAPGWPADGLPISVLPAGQGGTVLAPDGAGGVLMAWGDSRDGPIAVYAQRVSPSGVVAPGWPENGRRIVLGRYRRELMSDGAGGAYLSCAGDGDYSLYLQRFTGDGGIAPGWPEGGALVCNAPGERYGLPTVPDGVGGALLAWYDYRDYPDEIYLQRMQPDGSLYPGWPANGLRLTNNLVFDSLPVLAPDGLGGAYVAWIRYAVSRPVYHHVAGSGAPAPGSPAGGREIPNDTYDIPRLVADDQGGAILIWSRSDGCAPSCLSSILALKLDPDGVVPALVSLVSAEVEPGIARLTWFVDGGASFSASIERRTETSDWDRLADVVPDGTGRLVYEDRAVTAGTRYGYRLSYQSGADLVRTSEAWVEIPALRFALQRVTPNPSRGDPVITFSLASSEPATLELYDIAGRVVSSRPVGTMGTHEVRLDAREPLPAGVYTVRLRQGGQVAVTRAVILR
jgi:hypothetical protein